MAIVIAFAGKIGSGKTTVTKALAEIMGCPRASFGDYVRRVVSDRGLLQTRENLQKVGMELLETDVDGFCSAVLHSCGWRPGQTMIIDGLRHSETIAPIRRLISPTPMKIVFLAPDERTRLDRLIRRGDGDAATLAKFEAHSSEEQVNSTLVRTADLVLEGSKSLEENVRVLAEWIRQHESLDAG